MKLKEFRVPIRGQILALFGRGDTLTVATTHGEGLTVPLYRVNLYSGECRLQELPVPLQCITGDEESGFLYAVGTDNKLFTIKEEKNIPLGSIGADGSNKEKVLALKSQGKELYVLKESGLELRDPESGKLLEQIPLEKASAFDVDPTGRWLAVGFEDGRIQAFSREEEPHFAAKESERIHQSAVTLLLFDRQELHVISTAADKQIMMTQLRGKLEVTERGGKGNEGAVHCLIPGPENTFFSAGDDNLKLWPGGHTRRAPFTTKVEGPVKGVCYWKMGEEFVISLAKNNGAIFLMPLDDKNKPTDISRWVFPIKSWARREFDSADTRLREGALKKLAEFPDLFTVETIKDQAFKDNEPRLRLLAVNLLMELDHKEVDNALLSLLGSRDQQVHLTAFRHLLKRGKMAPLAILTKAIATGQKELSLEALPLLAKLAVSDRQAYSQLIRELENKNFELRSAALEELQKLHTGDPVQAVILGLNSSQQDIRVLALKYGYRKELLQNREFLRLIRRHLDDKSVQVRYSAFVLSLLTQPLMADTLRSLDEDIQRRLQEIDGKKAGTLKGGKLPELKECHRTPLIEAMATPALDICLAGAKALSLIKDPRAFGVLLQLSREAAEETRIAVCQAFSALGDENAVPRLRLLLHDQKINVADAAFTALEKLLEESELPEAGLGAPDPKIRLRTIALLARLLKKEPEKAENLAFLEKALNDIDTAVRREAFKTLLNADLKQSRGDILRFALRSAQSDIRLEVVMELDARKKEPWAQELLARMLNDADSFIREECFSLLRQSAEESGQAFRKALGSEYEDVRSQALELLLKSKKKEEELLDMVFSCLEDSSPKIRRKALEGLIAEHSMGRLEQALKSTWADVRVKAASAQAAYGLKSALPPLLEVIRSDEPSEKNAQNEWAQAVREAVFGVGLLGDSSAFEDLRALIKAPPKDSKLSFAAEAAQAMRFIAREEHRDELAALFSMPDKTIKQYIGLAMAAVGDPRGSSEAFAVRNIHSLSAAMMLRHVSREPLYSFMDEKNRTLRNQALLLALFTDLGERPGSPGGCLAGLAAAHLDIRLQAAGALEDYADRVKFSEKVAGFFNSRFNPVWEVPVKRVEELALLVTQGPRSVALAVLEVILGFQPAAKQESFDHWWAMAANRYTDELESLRSQSDSRVNKTSDALLPLAIGTYVGILRLKDASVPVSDRLNALKRLAGVAAGVPEQADSISTCLKVALHDNSVEVRNKAFDHLLEICPLQELAAEAIATEYRDIARKAMLLLLEQGITAETDELLKDIQMTFTNGLEEEANDVLVRQYGPIAANSSALSARSGSLRRLAVTALSHLYAREQEAVKVLHQALESGFKDVAQKAALFLSQVRDEAALPLLKEMLFSSEKEDMEEAVRGFLNMNLPQPAFFMLESLEKTPGHPLGKSMIGAIGKLGDGKAGRETLKLLAVQTSLREDIYKALMMISGYDQKLKWTRDSGSDSRVVVDQKKPRPLDDELLELLLKNLTELGESRLLIRLIPIAAYCPVADVDRDLNSLSKFKDQGVREAALSASALRLRKFSSRPESADTLREALDHREAETKFLAAEGLALAGFDEGLQVLLTGADMLANIRHRERSVLALGKLANPRALDYLLRLSENEEHPLREAAVESLGYMKETAQGGRIFELLKGFVRGTHQGLVIRALKGLRRFDSPEGWQLLREAASGSSGRIQETAIELLKSDSDPEAAIECLRKLIRVNRNYNIVSKICEALLRLHGSDSLEAYYDFLISPAPNAIRNAAPKFLERLCDEGEAVRLLRSLGEIQDRELFTAITTAIFQRDPLPAREALEMLPQAAPAVCEVILRILGRSGFAVSAGELDALAAGYWSLRSDELKLNKGAMVPVLEQLAWLAGRLGVVPPTFLSILNDGELLNKSIRRAVLQALVDREPGAPVASEFLPVIIRIAAHGEADLRPLAVELLLKEAPGEAEKIYSDLLNTPEALGRLNFKERALKDPTLLSRALREGLLPGQFSPDDIPVLNRLLTAKETAPKIREAILEVLGNMGLIEAESLLEAFAKGYKKGKDDEPDLGKIVRKMLRRSREMRHKQEIRAKNNSAWLEVTT